MTRSAAKPKIQTQEELGANVKLVGLTKYYGDFLAVESVSLQVDKGEFVALLGPSGAGKTTLLHLIAGFKEPSRGDIFLDNQSIVHRPPHQRNIGLVFQNYALFPHMTVFDNIAFPLKQRRMGKKQISRRVGEILDFVQLPSLADRFPKQLSGGQQQRVALARALVFRPPLLLMDEPLSNLDKKLRDQMRSDLRRMFRQLGVTVIFVTHDQEEALSLADRIAIVHRGRIEQIGSPFDIYNNPANIFIADFIGEANFFSCTVDGIKGPTAWLDTHEGLTLPISIGNKSGVLREGDTVTYMIRPEYISVHPGKVNGDVGPTQGDEDREDTCVFTIPGTVTESTFLGRAVTHRVSVANEILIDVSVVSDDTQEKRLEAGDPCVISWNTEKGRVLDDVWEGGIMRS